MKMIEKVVHIKGKGTTRIDGSKPDKSLVIIDEFDFLVRMYGKEAVLKMFEEARPKSSFKPIHPPILGTP